MRISVRGIALSLALGLVGAIGTMQAAAAWPQAGVGPAAANASAVSSGAKVWIGHYTEYEDFLRTAEIDHESRPKAGVTNGTVHVFFKPGGLAASAAVRTLGPGFYGGFFESYKSEVAAYKLDRLLELDMVPPTVMREYKGRQVSIQLWTENTIMLRDVQKQKLAMPTTTLAWARQLARQRVYDDLVANIDENATNLLFDKQWNIIKIDCSRCFTNQMTTPFEVGKQTLHIDRGFFERMKALDRDTLKREIGDYVEGGAIDALLARRDGLVKSFEKLAAARGENEVFLP
jgi:hypothetical protein